MLTQRPFLNVSELQVRVDGVSERRQGLTPSTRGLHAIDASLGEQGRVATRSRAAGSNEGIIHVSKPFFSVQFHPEAAGGPFDTAFLFEAFVRHVRGAAPQLTLLDPAIYRNDRASLKRVLLVGSGGLSIGQAGEFDYSGARRRPVALVLRRVDGVEVDVRVSGARHRHDAVAAAVATRAPRRLPGHQGPQGGGHRGRLDQPEHRHGPDESRGR